MNEVIIEYGKDEKHMDKYIIKDGHCSVILCTGFVYLDIPEDMLDELIYASKTGGLNLTEEQMQALDMINKGVTITHENKNGFEDKYIITKDNQQCSIIRSDGTVILEAGLEDIDELLQDLENGKIQLDVLQRYLLNQFIEVQNKALLESGIEATEGETTIDSINAEGITAGEVEKPVFIPENLI